MKNQVLPPRWTTALASECPYDQVSYVQCTVLGEHFDPVSSALPAPEPISTLFFCRTISFTASATAEFGISTIRSTPSWSSHLRATTDPTSGLFWWSAKTTSILRPAALAP